MDTIGVIMTEKLLKILVFLTILLAPLYVVRWSYFGILPTTLLEFLIWGVLGIWGIWKIQTRDFSWSKTVLDKPIVLLLLAGVISLWVTPDLHGGLGVFKAYFVEPLLFFYVLVDLMKKGVIGEIGVIRTIILSGLWLSVLGILQVVGNWFVFAPHEFGRAHAVFNSGNALALYLGPILTLGVIGGIRGMGEISKKVGWVIVLVMFVAFVLTKSQGGWVALLVTLGFWLLAKFLPPHGFTKVIKLFLFFLFSFSFLLFPFVSYFTPKNVVNPWERVSSSTLQVRFCVWEGTRNLLLAHPIFGAGLSGFKEAYSQKYLTCDAEPLEYPHNIFLTFWAELGILGVLGFLGIIWALFKLPTTHHLLPIIYLLIHGLVDVPYFKNDLSLQFWVLAALILWFSHREKGRWVVQN